MTEEGYYKKSLIILIIVSASVALKTLLQECCKYLLIHRIETNTQFIGLQFFVGGV